jgi:phenylacetate-CoA ligase
MDSLRRIISRYYFEKRNPRKYGGTFQQRFDRAQANTSRDPQQMEDLRCQLLGDLLRHAADQVPYYRQVFSQLGVYPDELLEPQSFAQLPLLTRSHLRQQLEELVAEDSERASLTRSSTGGSTGTPTPYYHGLAYMRESAILIQRNQLWTGWQPGDAVAKIWGSAYDIKLQESLRAHLDNLLRNETMLPAYG